MRNFSGELKLGFYRDGLHLTFENGKLTNIAILTAKKATEAGMDAKFPPLVFLKLLFCYRSFQELTNEYSDCYENNHKARLLLDSLFPKKLSRITHYL
jgi:hypothetical protein